MKCFFPTTILFIDDCEEFLHSMQSLLSGHHLIFFNSPYQALDYLKNYFSLNEFVRCQTPLDYLKKANRHELISSIVSDYRMDPMNGIAFFKEFQHLAPDSSIQKILLTGDDSLHLDHTLKGTYLDTILKKSEKNLVKHIETCLNHSANAFLNLLSQNMHLPTSSFPIDDTTLIQTLFQGMFKKLYGREFFWINTHDCMVVDQNRQTYRMFFRSEGYIEALKNALETNGFEFDEKTSLTANLPYALDIQEFQSISFLQSAPWAPYEIFNTHKGLIYCGYFEDTTYAPVKKTKTWRL